MTLSVNYISCAHRLPCGLCEIKKEACTYVYNPREEIFREWPDDLPSSEPYGWWDKDKVTCSTEMSEDVPV